MSRGLVIAVWEYDAKRAFDIVEKLGYRWMRLIHSGNVARIQIPVATAYAAEIAQGIEETLLDENIVCNIGF